MGDGNLDGALHKFVRQGVMAMRKAYHLPLCRHKVYADDTYFWPE